jgi:FKBP-type peptidyl-prolyl cis-trans isomerase
MRRAVRWTGLLLGLVLAGCASGGAAPDPQTVMYAPQLGVDFADMTRTSSGLWYRDDRVGTGDRAVRPRRVTVHYVSFLPDGTPVDSSLGGEAYRFELGSADVIRGLNEGVEGMQVGGQRTLVIRPGLAYGSRGRAPRVPPNAILVFQVQLLELG